jgi:flagellar assembly protein FliH
MSFASAGTRSSESADSGAGRHSLPDRENQALHERIARLEAELAAARTQSFESGRKQGDMAARAEMAPAVERMIASVAEIAAMRDDLRRKSEKEAVQLALLIAKRVLHRELSVDHNALNALARIIFERLSRAEACRVTVHPRFAAALSEALPGNRAANVQIDADPNCAPGTFLIQSREGIIDASVDAQLDEIGRGLTDRLIQS